MKSISQKKCKPLQLFSLEQYVKGFQTFSEAPGFYIGFLAFTTFDLVNNLVGILYITFNVFLYTVVVFLVNGKIK